MRKNIPYFFIMQIFQFKILNYSIISLLIHWAMQSHSVPNAVGSQTKEATKTHTLKELSATLFFA